jgi:hypothetical protein
LDRAGNIYVADYSAADNGGRGRVVVLAGLTAPTPALSSSSSLRSSPSSSTGVSSAMGDPQFVCFLGQSYQVHGVDQVVYSILSDPDVSLTARFGFLASGRCVHRQPHILCWSHPGSYFVAVGVRSAGGDRLHIESGSAEHGFDSVVLNGRRLYANSSDSVVGRRHASGSAALVVTLVSAHHLVVDVGLYSVVVHNCDRFVNIASVDVSSWSQLTTVKQPHGLLGQSWRVSSTDDEAAGEIRGLEGMVDDYAEAHHELLGCSFGYSRFVCE